MEPNSINLKIVTFISTIIRNNTNMYMSHKIKYYIISNMHRSEVELLLNKKYPNSFIIIKEYSHPVKLDESYVDYGKKITITDSEETPIFENL